MATITAPIKPFGGQGGTLAADVMTIPLVASTAVEDGDLIFIDTGTTGDANVDNNGAPGGGYFGVASMKAGLGITANGTIDRDGEIAGLAEVETSADVVQVYPAWPGRRFQGNIIDTGPGNHTGVYADDIRKALEVLESSDGYACVEDATAVPEVYTLEYVTPQYDDVNDVTNFGREAGVGVLNPRLVFMFLVDRTVFGT